MKRPRSTDGQRPNVNELLIGTWTCMAILVACMGDDEKHRIDAALEAAIPLATDDRRIPMIALQNLTEKLMEGDAIMRDGASGPF